MKTTHSLIRISPPPRRCRKIVPLLIFLLSMVFSGPYAQTKNIDRQRNPEKSHDMDSRTKQEDLTRAAIRISKENNINNMRVTNKPCITVADGSRLVFECMDALRDKSRYYWDNNIAWNDPRRKGTDNPATGPVFVEGASPGDALEIEIHDIRLSRFGNMMHMDKNKFLEGAEREDTYLEVEVVGDQMLYNGKKLPVEPMVGVMGTAGFTEMTTGEVWDNGGNMDTRIIKKHSKVLLPVFVDGALLAMGDVHAAMGDGEIFGKGVEIGADIEVTVRVRKDLKINRPMVINPDLIAAIASDPDIYKAKNLVIADMGKYLVRYCGFSSMDASALIAFYGNLRIGQVVNPQKTLRMEIEKKYIHLFGGKTE